MNKIRHLSLIIGIAVTFSLVGTAQGGRPSPLGIAPTHSPFLTTDIWTDKPSYTVGENIQIYFTVNRPAFIYIFGIDANGTIRLIFPNTFTSDNFVQEGIHRLPDGDWQFIVQPPAGIAHLQIIASLQRLPLPEPNPHAAGTTITHMLKHTPAAWWTTTWVSFTVAAPPTVTIAPVVCLPWAWWVPGHWVIAWQHVCPDARWRFTIQFHFGVPFVIIPPVTVVEELKARIFIPFVHVDMSVPIRFTARGSRGPIIRYHWDFGDSHTAWGFEVWHTFNRPGPHRVRLTVFDAAGRAHTATRVIWVRC